MTELRPYAAPRWLFGSEFGSTRCGDGPLGGNAQTLWSALFARRFDGPAPRWRRERWATPDGDFIDLDFEGEAPAQPLLVLFHGLEGSSASHYAQAFANGARGRGWRIVVPHFRGCSGELNLAPRAYHSGDHEEVGWILQRLRAVHAASAVPMAAVGVSLGGNALLRWAEEAGESAARCVAAVAAVSAPLDLTASGHAIGRGFNRQVYTRMFLRSMVPKALRKLQQFPGLFSRERLLAARDLYAFDDVFTAPLHGFRDADDYWARASAKPQLARIGIPALVLNAGNDPFVPASSLPSETQGGRHVSLWQPAQGGHVGFAQGRWPGHLRFLPEAVMGWIETHI